MVRKLLLLICVGTLSWMTAQAVDFEISEQSVFALSSTLKRITPIPRWVPATIATLCTSPSPAFLAKEVARSYALVDTGLTPNKLLGVTCHKEVDHVY